MLFVLKNNIIIWDYRIFALSLIVRYELYKKYIFHHELYDEANASHRQQ